MARRWLLASTVCLVACGGRASVADSTSGTGTGTSGGAETTTSGPGSSSGEGTTDDGNAFVPEEDLPKDCDPVGQDCPEGQKCAPGDTGFSCTDVVDDLGLGERCLTTEEDPCAPGLACAARRVSDEIGICMALCDPMGAEDWCSATWGYASAHCDTYGAFPVCDADCSPWTTDCPPGLACTLILSFDWECMVGGTAVDGDACEHPVDCAAGLFCAGPERIGDCEGPGPCCNELCNAMPDYEPGCSHPDEYCGWYCLPDAGPGQPRCQCSSDWDCARGLCVLPG